MTLGYIDLTDSNHLQQQALGGGVYDDRAWESYYFVMSDPSSGLSLISTIGFRPPRTGWRASSWSSRTGGRPSSSSSSSSGGLCRTSMSSELKGLEYSVEGAGWRLRYHSKKCSVGCPFTPINKIHDYITDPSDRTFETISDPARLSSPGSYEGTIELDGEVLKVGPCFGHRDHSWGIRDWSAVR